MIAEDYRHRMLYLPNPTTPQTTRGVNLAERLNRSATEAAYAEVLRLIEQGDVSNLSDLKERILIKICS